MKQEKAEQSGFAAIAVVVVFVAVIVVGVSFVTVNKTSELSIGSDSSKNETVATQENTADAVSQAVKNKISKVSVQISNYIGNNNGRAPSSADDVSELSSRYIEGNQIDMVDSSSGKTMKLVYKDITVDGTLVDLDAGMIGYSSGYTCTEEGVASAGSSRNYILWTQLESGVTYCLDNAN